VSTVKAEYGAENSGSRAALTSSRDLFVLPHGRREGFWANIRGQVLDLADPDTGYGLAPNPDDLFVASIDAALAAAIDNSLAARSLVEPIARISWDGANR
jgi:hypothetical protein